MSVGPIALALTDAAITLCGQTSEYWSGNYGSVREHNPIGHLLLTCHPLAFAVGVAAWIIFFTLMIRLLPPSWARVVAFAIMIGHALGTATWLVRWPYGLLAVAGLFLVVWLLDRLIWDSTAESTGQAD